MTPVPSRSHSSYDEIDTPSAMRADAAAVVEALRLGPPSLAYDDQPGEVIKREISVDEAAARLAGALNLYGD